jgi:ubiquinone/menaquinone biosynthesis C-methylase UbiE
MTDSLDQLQPTERFSERVENYSLYRPSYPEEVITYIQHTAALKNDSVIADIGSGTGIFSKLLLEHSYKVYGVEPNQEMRRGAEKNLTVYPHFISVNGKAEQTSLPGKSVDLITVAQAFHWMKPGETKEEFQRILKPKGYIVLLWNIRLASTAFLRAFEELKIQFGTDYQATRMVKEKGIAEFFLPGSFIQKSFYHSQSLNYEGLKGQLLSTSYAPLQGKPYEQMIVALEELFNQYHENGFVKIEYETKVFINA